MTYPLAFIRNEESRAWIVHNLLEKDSLFMLSKEDIDTICNLTEGYSGSDMKNLVKDASMGPLREALKTRYINYKTEKGGYEASYPSGFRNGSARSETLSIFK